MKTCPVQVGTAVRAGLFALGIVVVATPALSHPLRLEVPVGGHAEGQYEMPNHGVDAAREPNVAVGGMASPAGTGGGAGGEGGSGSITDHNRPRGNPAAPAH